MNKGGNLTGILFQVGAVILALLFTTLVLVIAGANPWDAYFNILSGAFSSFTKFADVIVAWIPLLIVTAALLVTFTAGLWNIGIEGQIMMGAIFTTGILRILQNTETAPVLILLAGFLAGALGGALWAALVGLLKIYGGVNEIFGGLGLNFVATATIVWLIFGPWKRPGVGSMSGTEPFAEHLWLPSVSGLRLSLWALSLAVVAIIAIYLLLQGTYFGLRLKAVGKNIRAAHLLGVSTGWYSIAAFLICGALAGIAGAIQVTATYHRLIPSISSGYGVLVLLVAMLVNYRAIWAAPVSLFFAALNIGSIQLPIVMKLDSALAGVLQGALVLFVVMMDGVRRRLTTKK